MLLILRCINSFTTHFTSLLVGFEALTNFFQYIHAYVSMVSVPLLDQKYHETVYNFVNLENLMEAPED